MQPQYRVPRSRLPWVVWLVPVVLACCLAVFLLAPALPGVVLRVVGFMPKGSVETFWESETVQVTPFEVVNFPAAPPIVGQNTFSGQTAMPTPVVVAGQSGQATGGNGAVSSGGVEGYASWFQGYSVPPSLTVSSTSGSFSVNTAEAYVSQVWFGIAVDGYPLGVIEYAENALAGICSTWLRGCTTEQFTVSAVDFRPNGMIVRGVLTAAGLTQPAGLVLTLGADAKSVVAQGVEINGQLYAVPASGDIATYVNQAVTQSNQALGQLQVQSGGNTLGLVQIRISDSALALIFR